MNALTCPSSQNLASLNADDGHDPFELPDKKIALQPGIPVVRYDFWAMPDSEDAATVDPILESLSNALFAFLAVKQRYPVLMRTNAAMKQLQKQPDIRGSANEGALQFMRDSFDMLVIDLYSIRESLTKDGLFDLLKSSPSRLSATHSTAPSNDLAMLVTSQIREAAHRLNGTYEPPAEETVKALLDRFRKETQPLDRDRNRVRAHRYEQKRDTSNLFLDLPDLQIQIDILERYLADLYLVVTHCGHAMDLADVSGNLAQDMADIIIHRSINEAVNYYGVSKKTKDNQTPWYWHAREAKLNLRK